MEKSKQEIKKKSTQTLVTNQWMLKFKKGVSIHLYSIKIDPEPPKEGETADYLRIIINKMKKEYTKEMEVFVKPNLAGLLISSRTFIEV